jgi:adenine-specific DNA methylase
MPYTLKTNTEGNTSVTVDLADLDTPYIQRSYSENWCHVTSQTAKGTLTMTETECSEAYAIARKEYDEAKARLDSIKHVSSIFCEKWLEDSDIQAD